MKKVILIWLMVFKCFVSFSQVAVNGDGSSPDPSAMLEVKSTSKGFLAPRMTTSQRNAIVSPATGLLVYDTDIDLFYFYDGSKWKIYGDDGDWIRNGNVLYILSDSAGIGTASPKAPLDVSGRISQTATGESVFLGESAGANDDFTTNRNTAAGYNALKMNVSGEYNTAVGYCSQFNNSGSENTSLGAQALYANFTGYKNTALGVASLYSNTSGHDNIAVGYQAMQLNTTGNNNIGIGTQALQNNSTGNQNTSLGFQSMYQNRQGYNNTAVGYISLELNYSGYNNTAVGNSALSGNISGYNNTALGANAFSTGGGFHNSTAIGYNAKVTSDNMVILGDTSVSWIGGYSAWHTATTSTAVTDVRNDIPGLEFILKLRPVSYLSAVSPDKFKNTDANKKRCSGFIPEEVEAAAESLHYDFDGIHIPVNSEDNYSLAYGLFVVPLVKAVQQQQSVIESQKILLNQQSQNIEELKKEIDELTVKVKKLSRKLQ